MDPVLAPVALLFLAGLGAELGLFNDSNSSNNSRTTDDDADTGTDAVTGETDLLAQPVGFDASLYSEIVTGTEGDDNLDAGAESAMAWFLDDGDDTLWGMQDTESTLDGSADIYGVDQPSGGDGNDHLILGPGDIAESGSGDDLFEIDHNRTDLAEVSRVNDFSQVTKFR